MRTNWIRGLLAVTVGASLVACGGADPYWSPGDSDDPPATTISTAIPGGTFVGRYTTELSSLKCDVPVWGKGGGHVVPSFLEPGVEHQLSGSTNGQRVCFNAPQTELHNFCAAANYFKQAQRDLTACANKARLYLDQRGLEISGFEWEKMKKEIFAQDSIWRQPELPTNFNQYEQFVIDISSTPGEPVLMTETAYCAAKDPGEPLRLAADRTKQSLVDMSVAVQEQIAVLKGSLGRGLSVVASFKEERPETIDLKIEFVPKPFNVGPSCHFEGLPQQQPNP